MKEEWVEDYLARSGDTTIIDGELEENEHGFVVWRVVDDVFIAIQVYGDGRYWDEWTTNKAKELGCSKMRCATKRNPETILKKYGGRVVSYLIERDIG